MSKKMLKSSYSTKFLLDEHDFQYQGFRKSYQFLIEAKKIGFYWSSFSQPLNQISSEVQEIKSVLENNESDERLIEELGDTLYAVIEACFYLDLNPETVFEKSLDKFACRFKNLCHIMKERKILNFSGNEKLALECWNEAKLT